MCYKAWDLRCERLTEHHRLELAVTRHFVKTRGDVANESHHAIRELNAEVKMVEARGKVQESYSALQAKRLEVANREKAIKTLARVLEAWETKFDERVQDLLQELQKGGDSDRAALQNAGYLCQCNDLNCNFPLIVDQKHYDGFWAGYKL